MEPIQYAQPLFVNDRRSPIIWKGKEFKYNEYFPWQELSVPKEAVTALYNQYKLYHNPALETQQKVGDRLSEFEGEKLKTLVRLVNSMVKQRCTTDKEFQQKRIKGSTVADKQRGLIRSWINRNEWALDEYYAIRDKLLGETTEE